MSEKGAVVHSNGTRTGRKPRGRFARHCAKWWWLHLLIFIIIAVVIVLVVIFVAVPKIAQKTLDEAELTVQSLQASDTKTNNYTLSINSTLRVFGNVHATLDEFDGVLYLEDYYPHVTHASVRFPSGTSDAFQQINTSQFINIADMAAFTRFNSWLLSNSTLKLTMEGDTWVHVSGISRAYPIHFKKTLDIPGLRNFEGTKVENTTVQLAADANGDNFFGTVTIPNYSITTFELGNISFYNYLLGKDVGTVFVDNVILRPGNNTFPMRANVSQADVLGVLQKEPYCKDGLMPFQLRGKSVVNHGQPLPYFADALSTANQTVIIDILTPVKKLGVNITCPTT